MLPDKIKDFGWFGAGWAVYKGDVEVPGFFPPLNDMEAQRDWLGGFGSAWTEYPDASAASPIPRSLASGQRFETLVFWRQIRKTLDVADRVDRHVLQTVASWP